MNNGEPNKPDARDGLQPRVIRNDAPTRAAVAPIQSGDPAGSMPSSPAAHE